MYFMSLGGTDVMIMNDTKIGLDDIQPMVWWKYVSRIVDNIIYYYMYKPVSAEITYLQLYYFQFRLESTSSSKKFLGNKVVQLV